MLGRETLRLIGHVGGAIPTGAPKIAMTPSSSTWFTVPS